jgi:hypothetical protein
VEAKFADTPDELWKQVAPFLPEPTPRGGRPPVPDRVVLAGIVYRMKTGCQRKALLRKFGSGSNCHLRFQSWVEQWQTTKLDLARSLSVSCSDQADVEQLPDGTRLICEFNLNF